MTKLIAAASGKEKHLSLIKAGYKTHHVDGQVVYLEPPTKGDEKAQFPGTCCLCGKSIFSGEEIRRWMAAGNNVAGHVDCVNENMGTGQGV